MESYWIVPLFVVALDVETVPIKVDPEAGPSHLARVGEGTSVAAGQVVVGEADCLLHLVGVVPYYVGPLHLVGDALLQRNLVAVASLLVHKAVVEIPSEAQAS